MQIVKPTSAPFIGFPQFVVGLAALYVLGFSFYLYQLLHPPCCDAINYLRLAESINSMGVTETQDTLRTLGYPWLLSLALRAGSFLSVPDSFLIFWFQASAYLAVVALLAHHIAAQSSRLATLIYLALCGNIFLAPYFGVSLTDSIYTTLSLGLILLAMKPHLGVGTPALALFRNFLALVFILSLAVVVRPAAVWLVVPTLYWVLPQLLNPRRLGVFLAALAVGTVPLQLQAVSNFVSFGVPSFLPVEDLGSLQVRWGIENIKYATWMGPGDPRNFYSSGAFVNNADSHLGLGWYFAYPGDAVKLVGIKLFAAFDWDYLLPYPRHSDRLNYLYAFASFSILWWGMAGSIMHATSRALPLLGQRFMPLLVFVSWAAVTLVSALELRFSLPMVTYFIVVGIMAVRHITGSWTMRSQILVFSGWAVFLLVASYVSHLVRLQATTQ